MAGSIATVYSKHIITASKTFRETNFVVSLPIPRNTSMISPGDCLQFHDQLRKAFNSCLKANIRREANSKIISTPLPCQKKIAFKSKKVDLLLYKIYDLINLIFFVASIPLINPIYTAYIVNTSLKGCTDTFIYIYS